MPKQIIWMGFAAYGIDRMFQRIIRDKLDHLTHQSSLQSESHKQNLPTSRAWEYDALPYCNHQHCKRRSRRSEGSAFFKTSARPLSGRRTFDQPLVEKPIDRYRKPKGLRLLRINTQRCRLRDPQAQNPRLTIEILIWNLRVSSSVLSRFNPGRHQHQIPSGTTKGDSPPCSPVALQYGGFSIFRKASVTRSQSLLND